MENLLKPLTDPKYADAQRHNLAIILLRMYTDLDKTVRRCDEGGTHSKWAIRVGSAATAGGAAVAGTTLVSGSTGTVAIVVGAVTATLGVIGSVVTALKLSDSVKQNQSDHAVYLPLLRQLGTYAAVNLFTADPQVIKKDLDDFATKISAVEAADASAINTDDAKPKVADTAPKAIAPGP
jgi:hypothetical protein